jgi:hypothetical protein
VIEGEGGGKSTIQMAGHSQSPSGIFASISIRPYLMNFFPFVINLADLTGGIMVPRVLFERMAQEIVAVEVQLPSPPILVKLRLWPLYNCSLVKLVVMLVKVGTICRPAASTYAFVGSVVVQSKEPVPNPSICT